MCIAGKENNSYCVYLLIGINACDAIMYDMSLKNLSLNYWRYLQFIEYNIV